MVAEYLILNIISDYKNNLSVKDISKKYNVNTQYIYKHLKINKVTKSASDCKIKYKIIYPDFFKSIKSEEQAYFLGLIYADGWVDQNHNQIAISLQEKDYETLKTFSDLIYENKPLRLIKKNVLQKRICNQYRFVITNKSMYDDAIKLGLTHNKTFKLTYPKFIHNDLIRHFIRGYFDGDGCIGVYKRKKKNGDYRICQQFNLIGTKDLLEGISHHFHVVLGLKKPIVKIKHKDTQNFIYVLNYASKKNILLIKEYLYSNSQYFFKRKFLKFQSIEGVI